MAELDRRNEPTTGAKRMTTPVRQGGVDRHRWGKTSGRCADQMSGGAPGCKAVHNNAMKGKNPSRHTSFHASLSARCDRYASTPNRVLFGGPAMTAQPTEGSRRFPSNVSLGDPEHGYPDIGANPTIRAFSVIYGDVTIGDDFRTGHFVLIRANTTIGDDVLVGTNTVIDGACSIGDDVSMQTGVYLPSHATVGDRVFLGPSATLTNDPYPLRTEHELAGPVLEDDVSVGAGSVILPAITVGEGSFIAAGAVVTEDVPSRTLAVGAPARHEPLPAELRGGNRR